MKKALLSITLCVNAILYAQNSTTPDLYTQKGAQAISLNGYFSGGASNGYFSAKSLGRSSYEYFLLKGLSISGAVYNGSSAVFTRQNAPELNTRFDIGLHTRYYFKIGNLLPYPWLFAELGLKTMKSPVSTGTIVNKSALLAGIGAQIQVKNNWFVEAYTGYNFYKIAYFADPIRNYANFNANVGLSYRIASKKK